MTELTEKCVIKKPMSGRTVFVLAGAAVGTMLLPQNAAVGAVVGGFVALFAVKAL